MNLECKFCGQNIYQIHFASICTYCYSKYQGKLYIKIIKAKNLAQKNFLKLSDPFCKIKIFQNNSMIKSFTTKTLKATIKPEFDQSFLFDLPHRFINKDNHIKFTVWNNSKKKIKKKKSNKKS